MSQTSNYPEAEKLNKVPVQLLGEFLEYLEANGVELPGKSCDQIIAEYAGCDYGKLEEERRRMLKVLNLKSATDLE